MKVRFRFKKGPHSIPLKSLMYIAWRNLVHKKLRAFLTIFGIVIGIGAIFFLLSFGIGLQQLVTSEVIGNQSINAIEITTPNSKILKLDEKALQRIRNLPHVERTGGSYSRAGILKHSGGEVDSVTYGVDSTYQDLSNLRIVSGRELTSDDDKSILVNQAALSAIGLQADKRALGKKINILIPINDSVNGATRISDSYSIVGIIDAGAGSEIFLPKHVFQTAGIEVYNNLKVEADDSTAVGPLRKQIESLGFMTVSPIDTIDQINQMFDFFNIILVGFGSIGMIVAVLGMFNTLTISLLERTKEIGLIIVLGGRNRDIRKLFIFEAVLLSLIGAIIGIILAILAGQLINIAMNAFARGRGVTDSFALFATPWWLVAASTGFMVLVGLVVVYLPARRAAQINPIDALRRE